MITSEEVIKELQEHYDDPNYTIKLDAITEAISAVRKINEIRHIIAIDNSVIQEDVMKYKMICGVLK